MSDDNVQKDFFVDTEPGGGSSKKFFKEKPIKKIDKPLEEMHRLYWSRLFDIQVDFSYSLN